MESADAAVGQAAAALGDLIVDVGCGQRGPIHAAQASFVEAALDPALAIGELPLYLGVTRNPFLVVVMMRCYFIKHRRKERDFEFFSDSRFAEMWRVRLVEA
jgi:hypothetical protein